MKALLSLVIMPIFAICSARYLEFLIKDKLFVRSDDLWAYVVNWLLGQLLFLVWVASLGATFLFALMIHHQVPAEQKCVIGAVLIYPLYLWAVRVVWFPRFHRWYAGRMGRKEKV